MVHLSKMCCQPQTDMAKKNFNQGINSLLINTRQEQEAPEQVDTNTLRKEAKLSVKAGLKEGETRATLILREDVIEKYKAISYWDRRPLKEVVDDALSTFLTLYEAKNGQIKSKHSL